MISKRAQAIEPSITLTMNRLAREMAQNGIDVVSFAGGEPDFPAPAHVKQAAIRAIQKNHTIYTPTGGIPELKEAICKSLAKEKLFYQPHNILVSAGAKQCLYNLLQTLVNPGDEVLVPVPYWVSFAEMVKLAGGRIAKNISGKTKLIIINSPNNPTGHVMSLDELKAIARHGATVISDETYDKLVYEKKHISIASLIPDRTFVVRSFSKTYAIPGWRLGYCAGNAGVIASATAFQDHTTSNPNSIAQYAALAALKKPPALVSVLKEYKKRRDYMLERLQNMGISAPIPDGAFYIFANVGKDSETFAKALLEKAHVAVVPGAAFGNNACIRMSFTIPLSRIREGMDRLENFMKK
ncbi:MAG: pyridoxal phosphate-dependent aminotransferase [Patescibacteria group bacterium]